MADSRHLGKKSAYAVLIVSDAVMIIHDWSGAPATHARATSVLSVMIRTLDNGCKSGRSSRKLTWHVTRCVVS